MATEDVEEMREHLSNAVDELQAAIDNTNCKWCATNLTKAKDAVHDIASLSKYTGKTATRVKAMTSSELKAVGGKIATLRTVVREEMGDAPITREIVNSGQTDVSERGLSMVGKKEATYIVMSEVALGAGMGFLANRLEERYGAQFNASGVWYMRLAPAFNLIAGLGLVLLGISGKVLKGPKMQMLGVAGGGAMMSNAALSYLEGFYATMGGATAARMAPRGRARAYSPAVRPMGAIPPQQLSVLSF